MCPNLKPRATPLPPQLLEDYSESESEAEPEAPCNDHNSEHAEVMAHIATTCSALVPLLITDLVSFTDYGLPNNFKDLLYLRLEHNLRALSDLIAGAGIHDYEGIP